MTVPVTIPCGISSRGLDHTFLYVNVCELFPRAASLNSNGQRVTWESCQNETDSMCMKWDRFCFYPETPGDAGSRALFEQQDSRSREQVCVLQDGQHSVHTSWTLWKPCLSGRVR